MQFNAETKVLIQTGNQYDFHRRIPKGGLPSFKNLLLLLLLLLLLQLAACCLLLATCWQYSHSLLLPAETDAHVFKGIGSV